jgi:hypothetical protein
MGGKHFCGVFTDTVEAGTHSLLDAFPAGLGHLGVALPGASTDSAEERTQISGDLLEYFRQSSVAQVAAPSTPLQAATALSGLRRGKSRKSMLDLDVLSACSGSSARQTRTPKSSKSGTAALVEADGGGLAAGKVKAASALQFDPFLKVLLIVDSIEINPDCELAQEMDKIEIPNTPQGRDFFKSYALAKGVTLAMSDKFWWCSYSMRKVRGVHTTCDNAVCLLSHRCKCNNPLP